VALSIVFRYLPKYLIIMKAIFKALNDDDTRRQVLDLLKDESPTAGDIANRFSISKPSI
jgi:ArsR family transcriptional regulator